MTRREIVECQKAILLEQIRLEDNAINRMELECYLASVRADLTTIRPKREDDK